MKKSEILQQARNMLARGTRQNICHAISGVALLTPGALSQCLELRSWIKDMLEGHDYYPIWLRVKHPDFLGAQFIKDNDAEQIFLTGRLAWMDWMIQSWKQWEAEDEQHAPRGWPEPIKKLIPF
jgi:hypothetical protein